MWTGPACVVFTSRIFYGIVLYNKFLNLFSFFHRWGFLAFELKDVPPGKYKVIPSTFNPGEEGPFFLEIAASAAFNLSKA